AAGDDVLGAHGQLAAPGRAPGQADPQAFPAAWFALRIDHAADDVRAEVADAGADGDAAAVPTVGQFRHVAGGDQPGPGPGAANRYRGFAAGVLLAIHCQRVL